MKIPFVTALGILVWLMISVTPFAQSVAYTFVTLDLPEPNPSDGLAVPEDINDDGLIVANVVSSAGTEVLVGNASNASSFRCAQVAFADAYGASVNDFGEITGSCVTEANAPKISGFVRDRRGRVVLLNVPGADHTLPAGINKDQQVVGTYYDPVDRSRSGLFRIHGFRWSADKFETIDFPGRDTYTTLRSINQRGQILGEYHRFDPLTNETREHNWFVYENGQFESLRPSLEWQGGPALFLADISDDGRIIGRRHNGGPSWDGLIRFEQGRTVNINLPPDILDIDVRGMNNKGQFVGYYITPNTANGYIATPANVPFTIPTGFSSQLSGAAAPGRPQPVSISCPAPVLTSIDARPMAITLMPTVGGGAQPVTTSCSPQSGSVFSVGQTPFTCTAIDARRQSAECKSAVVVLAPH